MSIKFHYAMLAAPLLFSAQTFAATIDFDALTPFGNYSPVPDGYGSTADVTVSYRTLNTDGTVYSDRILLWNTGYADLTTAAFPETTGRILEITLTAANPNQAVFLNSLAVGAYPTGNFTRLANEFRIEDGSGNALADYAPYNVPGNVAVTLFPNVSAQSLRIILGTDWDNGVNHISFDPVAAVPAPAAVWLFGSGLIGLIRPRRKP